MLCSIPIQGGRPVSSATRWPVKATARLPYRRDTGGRAWRFTGPRSRLPPAWPLPPRASLPVQVAGALCDTSRMIPVLIAILLYLVASGLLVAGIRHDRRGAAWLVAACGAVSMHALAHGLAWHALGGA